MKRAAGRRGDYNPLLGRHARGQCPRVALAVGPTGRTQPVRRLRVQRAQRGHHHVRHQPAVRPAGAEVRHQVVVSQRAAGERDLRRGAGGRTQRATIRVWRLVSVRWPRSRACECHGAACTHGTLGSGPEAPPRGCGRRAGRARASGERARRATADDKHVCVSRKLRATCAAKRQAAITESRLLHRTTTQDNPSLLRRPRARTKPRRARRIFAGGATARYGARHARARTLLCSR